MQELKKLNWNLQVSLDALLLLGAPDGSPCCAPCVRQGVAESKWLPKRRSCPSKYLPGERGYGDPKGAVGRNPAFRVDATQQGTANLLLPCLPPLSLLLLLLLPQYPLYKWTPFISDLPCRSVSFVLIISFFFFVFHFLFIE